MSGPDHKDNERITERLCSARRETQQADCNGKMATQKEEINGLKKAIYVSSATATILILVAQLILNYLNHK